MAGPSASATREENEYDVVEAELTFWKTSMIATDSASELIRWLSAFRTWTQGSAAGTIRFIAALGLLTNIYEVALGSGWITWCGRRRIDSIAESQQGSYLGRGRICRVSKLTAVDMDRPSTNVKGVGWTLLSGVYFSF